MAQLILLGCWGFIFWLFRQDMAWRQPGSRALIIPGAWLAIQGSRPVCYWFGQGSGEASPITTLSYLIFLVAALVVLHRRKVTFGKFAQNNKALLAVYAYFLLSILWSDLPVSSTKRLIKDFETVLVALVLLTEVNLAEAMRAIYVRVSYILFPLSVVFIKYFPDIGRQANRAGENMFTGVTTQKNSLGMTVFVFSLFVVWDLVEVWKGERARGWKKQVGIRCFMLVLGLWLLEMCDSQTSLLCLVLGTATFWICGRLLRMPQGKTILISSLAGIIFLVACDSAFGLSDMVIRALGRDPSLTGRTDIWKLVLEQQNKPWLGYGFYIFWDTEKGKAVIESFMKINSAHNGYLETYLDGGYLGVGILCIFLLVAGRRIINRLFAGAPWGRIGLVFWALAILYNFSETSYLRLDVLWFTLLLLAVHYKPKRPPQHAAAGHDGVRGGV
jgi:exopolysaccharide production protein ExoQ